MALGSGSLEVPANKKLCGMVNQLAFCARVAPQTMSVWAVHSSHVVRAGNTRRQRARQSVFVV
jgi:hypothetical protein